MTERYYPPNFPATRYDPIPDQAEVGYLDYKKLKGFNDVGFFLESYVNSGGEVTKNITYNNMVDVTTISASLANNVLAREGTSFKTSIPNTTYYLDFTASGDWAWGTTHPVGAAGTDYLTIAEVTTDDSGLVDVITDARGVVGGFRPKDNFQMFGYARSYFVSGDYGAKGDGVADDSVALQSMLNDAEAAGGGVCLITPGTYIVNQLVVPSNTEVRGFGASTVLKQRNDAGNDTSVFRNKNFATGDVNININNLKIDGNKAFQTNTPGYHYGLYFGVVREVLVDNVEIVDMSGDGIFIGYSWSFGNSSESPARDLKIINTKCTGSIRNQISILYVDGLLVQNCYFSGNSSSALVDIENHHNNDYIRNVTVEDCVIENGPTGQRTKVLSGGYSADNRAVKFIRNVFINDGIGIQRFQNVELSQNQFVLPNTKIGIEVIGSSAIDITDNLFDGCNIGIYIYSDGAVRSSSIDISRSRIRNSRVQGLYISSALLVNVTDNEIINNGAQGVYLEGSCTSITITNNRITDTRSTGKTQTYAINIESACTDILISGNYLKGNATGIFSGNSVLNPSLITIEGNIDGLLALTSTSGEIVNVSFGYDLVRANSIMLVDASANNLTFMLVDASQMKGRKIVFKKLDATANTITVTSAGGTIDGASTSVITTQWETRTYVSNGTNWYVI